MEALKEKLTELLNEPLAQQHEFSRKSLDQIASELESIGQQFSENELGAATSSEAVEGFERCRTILCTLLMQVESESQSHLFQVPVNEWFAKEDSLSPMAPELVEFSDSTLLPFANDSSTAEAPAPLTEWEMPVDETIDVSIPDLDPIEPPIQPEPLIDVPSTTAEAASIPPALHSSLAEEYRQLTQFLERDLPFAKLPNGANISARIHAQFSCFSIEAEVAARMSAGISKFWEIRSSAIRSLLDTTHQRVDLHAELKRALDDLAAQGEAGLYDLSFAGILNTLRYLLALPEKEGYAPSLVEAGTLLLLFGHSGSWETLHLQNHLGARGLTAEETTELAARLMRLFKTKNRILNASTPWTLEDQTALEAELSRLFELSARLETGGE